MKEPAKFVAETAGFGSASAGQVMRMVVLKSLLYGVAGLSTVGSEAAMVIVARYLDGPLVPDETAAAPTAPVGAPSAEK